MNFIERLNELMDANGLNKNTLSIKSEIPYTTIDGWYKKGYEGAKLSTLKKLAAFFDCSLDYLICGIEGVKKAPEISPEGKYSDITKLLDQLDTEQVAEVRGYIKHMIRENEAVEAAKQTNAHLA